MQPIHCAILTIGDELLIGQTIDTNSAWLAQQLNPLGIHVRRRIAVGDSWHEIVNALSQCEEIADIILITGGLGPTSDDITKPLLCDYFGGTLVENKEVLNHVIQLFTARQRPLLDVNLKQAMVPSSCEVLFNAVGTAPGMLFRKNGKLIASMPGVPFEMKYITETHLIPLFKSSFTLPTIEHRTLVTSGVGESFIADRLNSFEAMLPNTLKLAYLPSLGLVKLRLTGQNMDSSEIDAYFQALQKQLEDILVCTEDKDLEAVLAKLLTDKKKTLSTAESCTGGRISASLTSLSGSSNYFKGGMVTYSTESKVHQLGVNPETIQKYGVVSSETVIEMAEKSRLIFQTDYALSISGYLEKYDHDNVIWIGLASAHKTESKKITGFYDRQKNTVLATNTALNLLRLFILKD